MKLALQRGIDRNALSSRLPAAPLRYCHGLIARKSRGQDKAAPSIFGCVTDATTASKTSSKVTAQAAIELAVIRLRMEVVPSSSNGFVAITGSSGNS